MAESFNKIGHLVSSFVQDTLINKTIDFIWNSLEPWENDPEREKAEAEEDLNGSLCDFLASRASNEFPMITFRHEQRERGRRRIDLAAKPTNPIVIKGSSYTIYTPLIVIEGKRIPAPSNDRQQEYVTGQKGKISGGIQRFKTGDHGENHDEAIMIGYVQQNEHQHWFQTINGWISNLSVSQSDTWNSSEMLMEASFDRDGKRARFLSDHSRKEGCCTPNIRLYHFWIKMSSH